MNNRFFPGIFDEIQKNILPKDGEVEYRFPFYTDDESNQLFILLMNNIDWSLEKIKIYGKEHDLPRMTAWYGDEDSKYTYSRIKMKPLHWTKELLKIKDQVEIASNAKFNSVLLNLYRDGQDHVSWHADDEKELGNDSVIASISLGASRKFQLKHKYDKDSPIISLNLESGSLVIMKCGMQDFWLHRIASTKDIVGPRINLTFRLIK